MVSALQSWRPNGSKSPNSIVAIGALPRSDLLHSLSSILPRPHHRRTGLAVPVRGTTESAFEGALEEDPNMKNHGSVLTLLSSLWSTV